MDLAACLTHDIEAALDKGLTATVVTMDTKGAFDSVPRRRLMFRMREQGWPDSLVRSVGSFMEQRTARIRLDGATTADFSRSCGLPQGSPASPPLFMLYMAEALNEDPERRFSYADDIALFAASHSWERNAEILREDVSRILGWGARNKVSFDPEKCELMHFSRRRTTPQAPDIVVGDFAIKQVEGKALRWLGVWFDRKLLSGTTWTSEQLRRGGWPSTSVTWLARSAGHLRHLLEKR